ncbi:DUF11 domain-containing protein [Labedaea rhizosphaerae]|uniref:Putative repeat protein (TIGR01451 family) n=1 Tax=Labedaea rhizosphaerae TaxID=598644 RepID=A0A4R6SBZ9_LABRH|nr:DUF11 domain-containing protein [Labedaea rhizosphaerae]TDP96425.1 putative repeat protein (TIGR01451 family) [Labedaea rhizosphaerae]
MLTAVPAAALILALAGAPAAEPAPQLSIAVDSPQGSAAQGERLTFTVTVRNLGSAGVRGLRVSQSVPAGTHLESAEPAGTTQDASVDWTVTLKPAAQAVFHTSMSVVRVPGDQQRLATVVCARTTPAGAPLVCASHSAQLPSAAAVAAQDDSWFATNRWWLLGALVVFAALAAVAWLTVRRKRGTAV